MVAVLTNKGNPLDPTTEARARKLLKKGRAVIYKYRPIFTIQLLDREDGVTHPTEYKTDTGYQHIGISICSEKHEIVNEQRDLLENETERIQDRAKYRRNRRNRKRYRKARFDNRKIPEGWLAPSMRHRMEQQIALAVSFATVLPITSFVFEMGKFDTQLLKSIEAGAPIPEGTDYQHGECYGIETLREAVFTRDGYTCKVCGRSVSDYAVLHVHHIGFWKKDRTNRMSNLMTVCEKCHTSRNHKPGGKLFGLNPQLKPLKGATFMTTVRWQMKDTLEKLFGKGKVFVTYGAATKLARKNLHIRKTHSNDAYVMGVFHPKHRANFHHFQKTRRNSRILEKFRDAVYIDKRDGSRKKGSQIGCNRTNRKIPRNNDQNERSFRGEKVTMGKRIIRTSHYTLRPHDTVVYKSKKYEVVGIKNQGKAVALGDVNPSINNVRVVRHTGGWYEVK